jgi:hypothetical protein
LEELVVKKDITYEEYSVKLLETTERATRSRVIKMCKVECGIGTQTTRLLEKERKI